MSATANHIDKVSAVVQSNSAAAASRLHASWRRSVTMHGLDPEHRSAGIWLGESELKNIKQELDSVMFPSAKHLDHLFSLVGSSGCGVFLTNNKGVILDQRCRDADGLAFRNWGLWPGAVWSEAVEGTNGIGTCIAEERRVTIHRDEHFFHNNIGMSCIDVPIFGPDGNIIAALDVSSARVDQTSVANDLILEAATVTAAQIEADIFRCCFPNSRFMIADMASPSMNALLALDHNDIIVGAMRKARHHLGINAKGAFTPRPAIDMYDGHDSLRGFDRAERAALARALIRADGNATLAARALGIGRATFYRRMKRLENAGNPSALSRS